MARLHAFEGDQPELALETSHQNGLDLDNDPMVDEQIDAKLTLQFHSSVHNWTVPSSAIPILPAAQASPVSVASGNFAEFSIRGRIVEKLPWATTHLTTD